MSEKTISMAGKSMLPILLAGGLLLTACSVDKDYDLDEIDLTVGVGSDEGLQIPVSSTDTIKLSDVLDLEGTDCVVIADNGDYVFQQDGNEIDPTTVNIDQVLVENHSNKSKNLSITVPSGITGTQTISDGGIVEEFAYVADLPDEIEDLSKVGVRGAEIDLTLHFKDELSSLMGSIDQLVITFPSYMTLTDVTTNETCTVNGSALTFTNVPTSEDMSLTVFVSEIDLTAPNDEYGTIILDSENRTLELDGNVHVALTAEVTNPDEGSYGIASTAEISDFYITSATGRFNPAINLDDLGDVEITGVPDFLSDGNVVLDLYNPQIVLSVENNSNLGAYVGGTLTSIKDGVTLATIEVPEMKINAHSGASASTVTSLCICRTADGVTGYDVVNAVPDLCDLITTIPDRITFAANVRADNTATCEFNLGQDYEIQASYSISAPIAFGEDARIVYTDTVDGWNGDLEDIDLADDAYIELTADIENRIPAYLNVEAHAIDVNGETLNSISVEVSNTIIASADGSTSATTPLTITLKETVDGALNEVDGLIYTATADASNGAESVVGKTLNADHYLIAKNISIMLVGRVIADLN